LDVKKFHFSGHAVRRVAERNLSKQQIKDVVHYHDKKQQKCRGEHGGFLYRFEKSLEGKCLVVVAEIKKTEAWIVTSYKT